MKTFQVSVDEVIAYSEKADCDATTVSERSKYTTWVSFFENDHGRVMQSIGGKRLQGSDNLEDGDDYNILKDFNDLTTLCGYSEKDALTFFELTITNEEIEEKQILDMMRFMRLLAFRIFYCGHQVAYAFSQFDEGYVGRFIINSVSYSNGCKMPITEMGVNLCASSAVTDYREYEGQEVPKKNERDRMVYLQEYPWREQDFLVGL